MRTTQQAARHRRRWAHREPDADARAAQLAALALGLTVAGRHDECQSLFGLSAQDVDIIDAAVARIAAVTAVDPDVRQQAISLFCRSAAERAGLLTAAQ
jgi:hypothetical protein